MLNNGLQLPPFLYGTAWKENDTQRCVADALAAGFRGIDTANQRKHYFEAGVGAALQQAYAAGNLTRAGVFLQTKFTSRDGQDQRLPYDPQAPLAEQVRQSFASSLEHLHTDYLDSYVLHGPSIMRGIAAGDWEIWRAMEELFHQGKTKILGISNVNAAQLRTLCEQATVKPTFVQNRCFAQTAWDADTRAVCREHNVIYQGFSLLTANVHIFRNPQLTEIINRLVCTPAQLVFRFAQQIGMLPLTGTTDPTHMREDLACSAFELSAEDLDRIEHIV